MYESQRIPEAKEELGRVLKQARDKQLLALARELQQLLSARAASGSD
jgi:hypothetical protein